MAATTYTTTTTPPRRTLLASVAGLVAALQTCTGQQPAHGASPDPAAAVTPGMDAELIRICGEALAVNAEIQRLHGLTMAAEDAKDDLVADAYFDQEVALGPTLREKVDLAKSTPARTSAGRRAKARVALSQMGYQSDGTPFPEEALTHSICQDILAGEIAA